MFPLNYIISVLSILISVAFYTILERKMLSYIQLRKGPNKVGMLGILQPFSDAIKLFNKNLYLPENSNFIISFITPMMLLLLTLLLILITPMQKFPLMDNKQNLLLLFVISSLSVYSFIMIGWASNSKYANLGAIRSVAQMISYEVSFFLIILFITSMSSSYYFTQISESQSYTWFALGNMILLLIWLMSCLAEVNRSPFDFAEGESELVSGFNVDYMGGWFALIFLAEYSSMIILSILSVIMFIGSLETFIPFIIMVMCTLTFLWVRGTLPRFRYDLLMILNWKIFLPFIIFTLPLAFNMMILSY